MKPTNKQRVPFFSPKQAKQTNQLAAERIRLLTELHARCEIEVTLKKKSLPLTVAGRITANLLKNDELRNGFVADEILDLASGNEVLREMLEEKRYEGKTWSENLARRLDEIDAKYSARQYRILCERSLAMHPARMILELERCIRELLTHSPDLKTQIHRERLAACQKYCQQ